MKQYFAFQWHITDDCDQRCKHCYIFAENSCKKLDSMTWEQMQQVVANCEDFCEMYGRMPYFYITGGDPILHPDFWPLLELLAVKKIPFTIMGNPFHLTGWKKPTTGSASPEAIRRRWRKSRRSIVPGFAPW